MSLARASNTLTSFPPTKVGGRNTHFEFNTATRIVFGAGSVRQAGSITAELGRRALVVTDGATTRANVLLDQLKEQRIGHVIFSVITEPTTTVVRDGTERARNENCDLVVGIGGGSVLDAGKGIAALLANGGDPEDYLEVVGRGKPILRQSAPYLAVPTTAGTGSEVTSNAVLASPAHRVKVSLRSPLMAPRVALVDPQLTADLPPDLTASTGLDALTQLVEPYVSVRASPITDALCREGMRRVRRSLHRAFEHGKGAEAREDMALASLLGGLALANAGLGAVHGLAGPIGGMFSAPHGAVCARLLPHVMAVNVGALRDRNPQSEALRRYIEISRILTANETAQVEDGIKWVAELCGSMRIQPLSRYGVSRDHFGVLVEKAAVASSMKYNPIELTNEEMTDMLTRAL